MGGGGMLAGAGLVAALGFLAANLLKPQHSPSLHDGMASFAPRVRRAGTAAVDAASGFDRLGRSVAPVGPGLSQTLSVLGQFRGIDTSIMDKVATSIRNIASAINQVDTSKTLEFRSSISTLASQQVSQVVSAAVQLTRDDVQLVTDLVSQANKLAVASTVSNGDELSALVRSVAQIAQASQQTARSVAGGAAGPQNVEVTLKMGGSTMARQVVPIVNNELRRQIQNAT
jgi:hypothetical protein